MDSSNNLESTPTQAPTRARRHHSKAFKQQLVAEARRGDRSLASLALSHNINANLLRRWVKQAEQIEAAPAMLPVSVLSNSSDQCVVEIRLGLASIKIHGTCDKATLTTILYALK